MSSDIESMEEMGRLDGGLRIVLATSSGLISCLLRGLPCPLWWLSTVALQGFECPNLSHLLSF